MFSLKLASATEKFVTWWSEAGSKWGVNRTVAQVHALFYISPEPLNAEDIASALSFSRSNVSASLRELETWGLITPVYFRGDRKHYYEAIRDPWEMFRIILEERKRRGILPTMATLRACLQEVEDSVPTQDYARDQLRAAVDFFEVMIPLYDELRHISPVSSRDIAKLTSKVREVVG
jgi:DNA-binding transcriptional regulator GbsR (MarR family)